MPYKAFEENGQFCVHKIDEQGNKTGKSLGCHSSKKEANTQVRALYANESKEMDDEKKKLSYSSRQNLSDSDFALVTTRGGQKIRKYPIHDASHVRNALARAAQQIKNGGEGAKDAKAAMPKIRAAAKKFGIKMDNGKKEIDIGERLTEEDLQNLAEDAEKGLYADYHGEIHDSTESVPFGVLTFDEYDRTVSMKKKTEDIKKDTKVFQEIVENIMIDPNVGDKPGGIRKLANDFANRIESAFLGMKSMFTKEEDNFVPNLDVPFSVFKDKDGTMRWIARYSNNCRDQDNPPEIISAKSHEYFEEMIDKGAVPMPELWVWHMPLKIGTAEVVTFDKENGIAIAAGTFDDDAKEFAELVVSTADQWGVSHGMPGQYIERSKEDPTVIIKHITKEISVLPKYAAANKWADFQVLKEVDMTIKQEKLEQLKALGADEEMLEALQSGNKELSEAFSELGIERKEVDDEEVVDDEVVEEKDVDKEVPAEEPAEEKAADEEPADEVGDEDGGLRKEMLEALTELGTIIKSMNERLTAIEEKQQEDETVEDKDIFDLPAMSLKEALLQGLNIKENSARNAEETVIDGRTKLAKDKPAETKETAPSIVETGVPFLDQVLTNIVVGDEQPA